METNPLYEKNLNRIRTAVELGTPDRVPVVLQVSAFAANHQGVRMADYCASPALSTETIIKSMEALGGVDGVTHACFNPRILTLDSMCKVMVPGDELPPDEMWQVHEVEVMLPEDYDKIIAVGCNEFMMSEYLPERMDNVLEKLGPLFDYMPRALAISKAAGFVPFAPVAALTPFQKFMGGRSMAKFNRDLFRMPEKVLEACEIAQAEGLPMIEGLIGMVEPFAVMVPIGRASRQYFSRKIQEKFIFPHYKELCETVIAAGAYVACHVDDNFDQDLDFMLTLPKGKCIFQADSSTDIFKLKEAVGDHMCIMGDIPAAMLAMGTPDEVYAYASRLVREIGPKGFILSSGCDVPPNAKIENVKAMISAATGN